ncbi:MAG: hypothetical protein H8E85_00615 [Candidatus Marinimicrobia bacterium]|nr:hypothetical protein [Candidatus Neomarinimicrobiota bacterium]
MHKTEDGGILIDKDTIEISKEILIAVGGIILLSRIINEMLGINHGTVVACKS